MFRVVNLFVLMITILTAFALYRVKYDVGSQAKQVSELRKELDSQQDAIALLQAEWSHLNEPARIQELAVRHLQLQPTGPRQIVSLDNLPRRARDPYIGYAGMGADTLTTGSIR